MSATNINMTISKPCMYYDCTYPFAGLKKPTENTDDILKKQYNYSGAFVSHGGLVGETIDQNTEGIRKNQYNYSKAFVSHGETIKEVPESVPKQKKYMWTSFVDFFKQKQKFQRYPFLHTPNI
jgi:hypothetical protein